MHRIHFPTNDADGRLFLGKKGPVAAAKMTFKDLISLAFYALIYCQAS
ncbi:hypothetical protein GGC47_005456 [Bosea sp. OAE752]